MIKIELLWGMKLNCRIWLFIFLLNVSTIVSGQNPNGLPEKRCPISILNYGTGLLNNTTNFIITDALGFTWISTKIGLQRFNGNQLETIIPVLNKDTFTINQSVYLFNLPSGMVWISYQNRVLEFNPFRNTFRILITTKVSDNSGFSIVPLKETPEGIWCMQEKKGIVLYSPNGKMVTILPSYNSNIINKIIHSEDLLYNTIITSDGDYIFIAYSDDQILKINTNTREFNLINCEQSSFRMSLASTENKLFVATNTSLTVMNILGGGIAKKFLFNKINTGTIAKTSINLNSSGQILVSLNNHLYEFDTSGNFEKEITDLNREPVVKAGFINKVYSDKFKRIWLLSNDDIKRIQNVPTPFVHFMYPDAKNNFVRSLYYDEQKHILLAGCFNGGLQIYDTLSNPLWKEPLMTKDVKDILAIEKLTPDQYLIITFKEGWYILTLSTKQTRPFDFPSQTEALIRPRLVRFTNNLQRIDDSTLLIATDQNIFRCVFYKNRMKFAAPLMAPGNDIQNGVDCFLSAIDKMLWVGTSTGMLYKIDKNQHREIYPIPGNYGVRTIAEDSVHHIWVGTDKGLYVYSQQGQLIQKFSKETGLLNDCIYSLLPVRSNSTVFAASNLGLSFISLPGIVKNYSKELGLQDMEFNTASCVKTKSGKLYFGGVDGITSFYPDALSAIKDTPGLYITRLAINDIANNFSSGAHKGDSILLNYSENHLQLDITAMGLLNPDEYIYKYRLKGFQNNWQVTHKPDNINYILPPGKYVLEIICSPNLSTNAFFKKNISVIISPPWWQTWWFKILSIIFFVAVIVLIVNSYNRNKYNQRIKILQYKNEMQQEKERISRDLHDNLGAQANALLYGTEQLQRLHPSESMLIDNLNTTARDMMISLRETIWVIKHNNTKASEIWFRIINFCKQLSLFYKELKISTEGELPENFEFKSQEALHIVLIVQESLNNAVRHSGARNIITQSIVQKNVWTIKVKDNGKGISKEGNKESFGGFGLSNMQERAFIAKINLTIDSEEGKGTSITLHIPLEKKSE